MKRTIGAMAAVFVLWAVLDFIFHGLLLGNVYARSPNLWRPMDEMQSLMWGIYVVTLIATICYVYIIAAMLKDTSQGGVLRFGLVYGIGVGVSWGFGSFMIMPMPYILAWGWFLVAVVETVAGAWLAWFILHRGRAA